VTPIVKIKPAERELPRINLEMDPFEELVFKRPLNIQKSKTNR